MIFDEKKWKKLAYKDTLDYLLASKISSICNFKITDIIVWYAKKNKDHSYYFLFQYKKKYFKLDNTSLKEISKQDIFYNIKK